MALSSVKSILEMIDQLSPAEQATLDQELARRAAVDWEAATDESQRVAASQGIDQSTIDETIRRHRYGK